jgi:type I restriction enzyme, S subunit
VSDGVTHRAAVPVGLPSELPRGWQSKQLRRVASAKASNVDKKSVDGQASVLLCNYVDVYYNRQIVSTLDFMEATATDEQAVAFELRQGDVLITKDSETPSDIGVPAYVPTDLPGVLCGYHLSHIRPGKELSGAFLTYCFQAGGIQDHFYSNATGVTRFGLSRSDIGTCPIPLPPLDVQRAIAAHLDRETAKIDTLIAKKRELIAKLKEQRSALISRTVTRGLPPEAAKAAGLDPNPPMKDSGVEWLGEVPAHWTVKPVKFLTQIVRGQFTHRPRNDPSLYDGTYPFVQTGDIARAKRYVTEYSQTLNDLGLAVSKQFPEGTLVMTIAANIGDMAVINFPACFPDSIVGFIPTARVDIDFLYYLFLAMKRELLATATLNTQLNLNVERIAAIDAVQPPVSEQRKIADYLDRACGEIDSLLFKVETVITRLTEYRAALITAAVTGQLDVR